MSSIDWADIMRLRESLRLEHLQNLERARFDWMPQYRMITPFGILNMTIDPNTTIPRGIIPHSKKLLLLDEA
jgi:hypothetical protein